MGDFAKDTELQGSDGHYRITLSRDWEVWGPNGGYVAAIALRAAGMEARIRRPACFAAHYLRMANFAPVEVNVTPLHRGRSSESLRVSLHQDGAPVLEALVRTAAELEGLEHDTTRAPDVPGPEGLLRPAAFTDPDSDIPRLWSNFEVRPTETDAWDWPRLRSTDPIYREWIRFLPRASFDDPFIDAARALVLVDTMLWPASNRHHIEHSYRAPNLDVVTWFHRPLAGH